MDTRNAVSRRRIPVGRRRAAAVGALLGSPGAFTQVVRRARGGRLQDRSTSGARAAAVRAPRSRRNAFHGVDAAGQRQIHERRHGVAGIVRGRGGRVCCSAAAARLPTGVLVWCLRRSRSRGGKRRRGRLGVAHPPKKYSAARRQHGTPPSPPLPTCRCGDALGRSRREDPPHDTPAAARNGHGGPPRHKTPVVALARPRDAGADAQRRR